MVHERYLLAVFGCGRGPRGKQTVDANASMPTCLFAGQAQRQEEREEEEVPQLLGHLLSCVPLCLLHRRLLERLS